MCKPHYYCRNIHCKEWDTTFHARSAVELIHKKIAREFTPWAITQGLADNWVKDVKLIGNYLKVQEWAKQMKPKEAVMKVRVLPQNGPNNWTKL